MSTCCSESQELLHFVSLYTHTLYRRALEAKAALYDRLCRGEGVRGDSDSGEEGEGEGEQRYMVDFTRKIHEEVRLTYVQYM